MNDTDKVAAALKEKGWHKGELYGKDGSVCLIGAVMGAGLDGRYARAHLVPAIERLYPERFNAESTFPVAQFNDHPDTTLEDVHLVLKHAREEE